MRTFRTFRTIATIAMSIGFGIFGVSKLLRASIVTDSASWDRLDVGLWTVIGLLEVAAVTGLLLALNGRFRQLGLAAASGLVVLTISAIVFHLVNGDAVGDWMPALMQGLFASGYIAATLKIGQPGEQTPGTIAERQISGAI